MNENTESMPATLAPPRRSWIRPLISGLIILFCGIIIGGATVLWFISSHVLEGLRTPEIVPQRLTNVMQHRLNLTPEQADRVLEIHNKYLERFLERRRQARPNIEKELDALQAEINAVLTPEQAEKWDKRFSRFRSLVLPPLP
ncbi:MAG TPA: hypothetical protein ENN29_12225 [Candidatus Hydrogenedentes bacterium]|nr:hypothetical protein [Candidatus Hydrogenedentota bacterium]